MAIANRGNGRNDKADCGQAKCRRMNPKSASRILSGADIMSSFFFESWTGLVRILLVAPLAYVALVLILRPSAVRIGMFCRFGSDDEMRPVGVEASAYEVWTRFVSGWM